MMIRTAHINEASEVVELIMDAIVEQANVFTGYLDSQQAKEAMMTLFKASNTRFSSDFILVACENESIVGQITAYPADWIFNLNKAFRAVYNKTAYTEAQFQVQIQRILDSREGFPGEYYIDSLSVSSDRRGRGIGKTLINAVAEKAAREGFTALSLLVDLHNYNAEQMYHHLGFEAVAHVRVLEHEYKHMVKLIST